VVRKRFRSQRLKKEEVSEEKNGKKRKETR
jgi:hypothetical protein